MTIQEEREELLGLADDATPGPWERWSGHSEVYADVGENIGFTITGNKIAECEADEHNPEYADIEDDEEVEYLAQEQADANAAYIAFANPERIRRLLGDDGWVSVEDRLPEQNWVVDVWCVWPKTGNGSRMADVNFQSDDIGPYWHGKHGHIDEKVITHWRPLPSPPKETT